MHLVLLFSHLISVVLHTNYSFLSLSGSRWLGVLDLQETFVVTYLSKFVVTMLPIKYRHQLS